MKCYRRSSISEFLDDNIVYRNLVPVDARLRPLSAYIVELGIPVHSTPRKNSLDYAQVIARIIAQARTFEAPQTKIERVIYLGDTRMNDGSAFMNICRVADYKGFAFIGDENKEPFQTEIVDEGDGQSLYLANRWEALNRFDDFLAERQFPVDESTVVLIDIDKTALGARGRNDHVIDQARVDAAFETVSSVLGDEFNAPIFSEAYQHFNQQAYHAFTLDNQDYLVYLCLILASSIFEMDDIADDINSGRLVSFSNFLAKVEAQVYQLPITLLSIHEDVFSCYKSGDPTPFKAFRRKEYQITSARMGHLVPKTPLKYILDQEIVITQEVCKAALIWRQKGALIFGLSDKPDEASIPTVKLAKLGQLPLHRITTDVIGEGG